MRKQSQMRKLSREDVECTVSAIGERINRDAKNVARAELMRKGKIAIGCEDRRELVKVLLQMEATDNVRRELESLTIEVDDLYGKVLFLQEMERLEIHYAYLYMIARKQGYRKQFASFIQDAQYQGMEYAKEDYDGTEATLDYLMLANTARDYRLDDEHEVRNLSTVADVVQAETWARQRATDLTTGEPPT